MGLEPLHLGQLRQLAGRCHQTVSQPKPGSAPVSFTNPRDVHTSVQMPFRKAQRGNVIMQILFVQASLQVKGMFLNHCGPCSSLIRDVFHVSS